MIAVLRQQGPGVDPEQVLLSRQRLLEAVTASNDPDLQYVARVLAPCADDQNVPMVWALLCDSKLIKQLEELGHHKEALVLRLYGDAHAAWDMSGLTHEWRNRALLRWAALLRQLVAPQLRHSRSAASGAPTAGLPRDLLVAIVGNIDLRRHMLEALPWLWQLLHERASTTDDVESEFSNMSKGCAARRGRSRRGARCG